MNRIKLGSFAGEQVFMAVEGEAAQDIKESAQHIPQHSNGAEPAEICPNCINGMNVDHTGLFGGSRKCVTCGGTGKLRHC